MSVRRRIALLALALASLCAPPALAQSGDERLRVPYGVGERMEYEVRFSGLRVGSGSMEVAGLQDVRGREAWHTIFQVKGGTFFYRVNDVYESWIDTRTGNSLRFRQDLNEGSREVERIFNFFPDSGIFIEEYSRKMAAPRSGFRTTRIASCFR